MLKKFEKIIQALKVRFVDVRHGQIKESYKATSEKLVQNRIIWVYQDGITVEVKGKKIDVKPGDLLFLPTDAVANIHYHSHNNTHLSSHKNIHSNSTVYSRAHQPIEFIKHEEVQDNRMKSFSYIDLSVKVHIAIDFFEFVKIEPFIISNNFKITQLLKSIFRELSNQQIGQSIILHSTATYVIVEVLRYMLSGQLENHNIYDRLLLQIDALVDPRVLKIFDHTNENIAGNLRNGAIAKKVNLGDEYVGQFFKKQTAMTLQNYVQKLRLETALEMLKTTELQIQEISKAVGFKDFAYFCKKFRIFFGNSPKRLQKKFIANL